MMKPFTTPSAALLRPHPYGAQQEVAHEADGEGDRDAEAGEGPVAGLAAETERFEQVSQPTEVLRAEGLGDQSPADHRGDRHHEHGRPADGAVPATRGVEGRLVVVTAPQHQVREEPPAP